MTYVSAQDGTKLYVKDWGQGAPVVLLHGWPLNADSWEYQAVKLAEAGLRVVAYDRRGFGRSDQPWSGYDYDTLAEDLHAVITELGLERPALVGFSMGGGEVARYLTRHPETQVAKAALVASVVPYMLKTDDNPDGVPESTFEQMKDGLRKDRPEFLDTFFTTFYGDGMMAELTGRGVSDGILHWSLMMAMMASPKATLACVDAFGKTDFRPDLASFTMPTLIVHGAKDKTVPIACSGEAAAKAIPQAQLLTYDGEPHGLTATQADRLTEDLLTFLKG